MSNPSAQSRLGYPFTRVNNDVNGNPRYVLHFLAFSNDYAEAHRLANRAGFKVYRGKDYGGGFVTQSYSLEDTARFVLEVIEGAK